VPVAGRHRAVGLQGADPHAGHRRRDPGAGGVERPADGAGTGAGSGWTTVGVHGNVVEASWLALVDALAYAALRRRVPGRTLTRRVPVPPTPSPASLRGESCISPR
jgi:hypothetical protein